MSRSERLYHLTPIANLARVMRNGLRADTEGAIYAFTTIEVANTIARDQVGIGIRGEYAILRILRGGVTGVVESDNVAEYTAGLQRRIIQPRINASFLRHHATRTVKPFPTAFDVAKYRRWGATREQIREMVRQLRQLPQPGGHR